MLAIQTSWLCLFSDKLPGTTMSLIDNFVNLCSCLVDNADSYRDTAIQAVRCARHSGVVGPDGHLHLIE